MLDATTRKSLISFTTLSLCLIKLNDKDVHFISNLLCVYVASVYKWSALLLLFFFPMKEEPDGGSPGFSVFRQL